MRRFCALFVAALLSCPRPTVERQAVAVPSRQHDTVAGGFYAQPAGLADDVPEETSGESKIRRDLAAARDAGAHYLRFAIGWDGVETAPGTFDWRLADEVIGLAPSYGVVPLPYVCYTPKWLNPDPKDYWRKPPSDIARFGTFLEAAARRYAGRVPSWELWNEPDNDFYWLGSVEEFARLIRAGAEGVRRGDPRARIVLGGMSKGRSPFLETLLREHHLGDVVDVVSAHGYLETWDPRRTEDYPAYISEIDKLLRETAPRDDFWMAEFGYSDWRRPDGKPSEWSYAVHAYEHTSEFQAVALLRAHALALATGALSLTTWYRIDDLPPSEGVIGDDNNKHLGVLDVQGSPKPAFSALRLWNRLLDGPVRTVHAEGPALVRAFEKPSGELIVLAWLPSDTRPSDPQGRAIDPRDATIAIALPHGGSSLQVFDPLTGNEIAAAARLEGAQLAGVRLRGDSVFVARVGSPR
ncbi:MAG: GH39 family glycosyl hydrolase [Myxococcales bacterium]